MCQKQLPVTLNVAILYLFLALLFIPLRSVVSALHISSARPNVCIKLNSNVVKHRRPSTERPAVDTKWEKMHEGIKNHHLIKNVRHPFSPLRWPFFSDAIFIHSQRDSEIRLHSIPSAHKWCGRNGSDDWTPNTHKQKKLQRAWSLHKSCSSRQKATTEKWNVEMSERNERPTVFYSDWSSIWWRQPSLQHSNLCHERNNNAHYINIILIKIKMTLCCCCCCYHLRPSPPDRRFLYILREHLPSN